MSFIVFKIPILLLRPTLSKNLVGTDYHFQEKKQESHAFSRII